ncbi:MAG: tRNA (guanosine(37)-N1)-methyltransferase TrmD [Candidatus Dormibacteria bacterium]
MKFDVVTLFPELFPGPLGVGVVGRALAAGTITVAAHDLRSHAGDRHRQVDDIPYGGGAGMVLKPEPIFKAVRALREAAPASPCVLLTPQGRRLDHSLARDLAAAPGLVLVCGRYEGFDERVRSNLADLEVSIGDYVLSGGDVAAMVLIEVVARLLPGVLGDEESALHDSFSEGILEHPHYTRPPVFDGLEVPSVLLGGNHRLIQEWRREQALERTRRRRPDLLGDRDSANQLATPAPGTRKDKGEKV